MARAFAITTASDHVNLDAQGHGEVTYTISNTTTRPLRAWPTIKGLGSIDESWLSVVDGGERSFSPGESHQFVVKIKAPADAPTGKYSFRLNVISGSREVEDESIEGPAASFEVKPAPVPTAGGGFPWWLVAVAGVIVLLGGLAVALLLKPKPAESDEGSITAQQDPPSLPTLYLCDAQAKPGSVFRLSEGKLSSFFTRSAGSLHAVATLTDGTMYFVDSNGRDLMRVVNGKESVAYTHSTYVRDVAVNRGQVYFSESTGAGGDGKIHRLVGSGAELFYTVRLQQVDGFWAGNFAFDPSDNLWLSSGNRIPASLYRVAGRIPQAQYMNPESSIQGFDFESSGNVLYVSGGESVVRLTGATFEESTIYSAPAGSRLRDVSVPPSAQ